MIILEENFKWHLEAFASELFMCYPNLGLHSILITIFDGQNFGLMS